MTTNAINSTKNAFLRRATLKQPLQLQEQLSNLGIINKNYNKVNNENTEQSLQLISKNQTSHNLSGLETKSVQNQIYSQISEQKKKESSTRKLLSDRNQYNKIVSQQYFTTSKTSQKIKTSANHGLDLSSQYQTQLIQKSSDNLQTLVLENQLSEEAQIFQEVEQGLRLKQVIEENELQKQKFIEIYNQNKPRVKTYIQKMQQKQRQIQESRELRHQFDLKYLTRNLSKNQDESQNNQKYKTQEQNEVNNSIMLKNISSPHRKILYPQSMSKKIPQQNKYDFLQTNNQKYSPLLKKNQSQNSFRNNPNDINSLDKNDQQRKEQQIKFILKKKINEFNLTSLQNFKKIRVKQLKQEQKKLFFIQDVILCTQKMKQYKLSLDEAVKNTLEYNPKYPLTKGDLTKEWFQAIKIGDLIKVKELLEYDKFLVFEFDSLRETAFNNYSDLLLSKLNFVFIINSLMITLVVKEELC